MKLHTVFITHDRLELTRQAIASYVDTVSVPFHFTVIDNGSTDGTEEWLREEISRDGAFILLGRNFYPGKATNIGWSVSHDDDTHLQRADNDFAFVPGWCEHVERIFKTKKIGQLGLRTEQQEPNALWNVGGNCIIRRELWDAGLRYDERPWPEFPPGYTEDSFLSPAVEQMKTPEGQYYTWTRVKQTCIIPLSGEDAWNNSDPYYEKSWGARHLYGRTP